MALRLSKPSAASDHNPRSGERFDARADAALLAGDLKGWRALFADAGELEDVHRRYKARATLVERALGAAKRAARKDVPALYLAVAAATVELLEEEPREPYLLNYCGVALYELGALDAAESLFKAARRLDDTVPHVEGNLRELARLRRGGKTVLPRLPGNVKAALKPLAARAKACAGKAKPVAGLTLSLCMIVKDEEEMLPRCLEAVRDHVDEIVVVDTGSTDRTVEIAESFGARVVHHEWNGSFSDARNVSIEAATGDWLMYLDADEVVVAEDAARLRELTGRVWREAFYLVETNFTGDLEDGTAVHHNALRVWRNRPAYRFRGRLHEQFAWALPGYLPERLEHSGIRVEHYGYLGAVRDAKEKTRRNIELLEQQAADGVDTPFQAFNLGSEYGAIGANERALEHLEKAWRMLEEDPERTAYGYVPSLTHRYVKALRFNRRFDDCVKRGDEGLALFPGFTDLVYEQACAARDEGDLETAAARFVRCVEMGDAPSKYSATVGAGSYLALVALAEVRGAMGAGDDAEALLVRCLDEYPRFIGSVLPLATVMLGRGATAGEVVAAVEARVETMSPSVHFLLGTALYEAGETAAAEEQFRAVVERQPGSGPARAALAEAVVSQGRFVEAAEVAAEVEPGLPCSRAARRTELFALLVAGELERTDAAFERGRADLTAGELALFRAWDDAAAGRPLPASLPFESIELLATTLEALLRVQEIDAFAALVPLVERVGLGARDRHELLAGIYLRRGFLESAADEWIAACQQIGPDAPALVGLAQVAVARDLREDALHFAREARAIDPSHAGAARLVEVLGAAA